MKKSSVLFLCVLLSWISVSISCNDWQECPKFKKKKTPPIIEPSHDEPEDESCDPYNPAVPNFSRPGQRISITKCHEYVWEIKMRIERSQREQKCRDSKWKNHVFKREVANNLDTVFTEPVTPHPKQLVHTLFIMGGHDAFPKEFPHMGAIGWRSSDPNRDWKFMCGSSLISPKFALTAAHCSSADSRDTTISDIIPKIVRFGVEDIIAFASDHSAEDRNISKVIVHPQYRSPIKYFDLALLELDRPIVFNKFVQPACLWTEDMDKVKTGTVTGWGVTDPVAHEGHPYLQAATLDVIDDQRCEDYLWQYHNRRWRGLEEHQFCAGQMEGGVDSCQGDSGGPFQMKIPLPPQVARWEGNMHYLVGVTSFGISCGKKDLPGIYSKVSKFLDWIEPIVWK